uniref:Response regulator n=1 Tax=Rheinheimera sp. BAL341 TaxID=1708203 RepID=A0A486XI34_9GAMM
MFNVLFIDDDNFMLRALVRLARRLRPDWRFWAEEDASCWARAVDADVSFDLVICDYLMPTVNGDKVLAEVAEAHPAAIRALLTGDISEDVICSSAKIAHFVLSKPFNEHDILQLFKCVELAQALPVSREAKAMLGSSALLMPLPDIVKKVQAVLQDENCDAADIVNAVQREPLLAAKLLQLANSAFMGFSRSTLSLEEAIKRLGLKLTAAVITSIAMEQASIDMLDSALHSKISTLGLEVANCARQLCNTLGFSRDIQDELFVTALLSVIGQLITSSRQWQQEYATHYRDWSSAKLESVVSSYMLTLWGYSEKIIQAVYHSAAPDFSCSEDNFALLLYLARQQAVNQGPLPVTVVHSLSDGVFKDILSKQV